MLSKMGFAAARAAHGARRCHSARATLTQTVRQGWQGGEPLARPAATLLAAAGALALTIAATTHDDGGGCFSSSSPLALCDDDGSAAASATAAAAAAADDDDDDDDDYSLHVTCRPGLRADDLQALLAQLDALYDDGTTAAAAATTTTTTTTAKRDLLALAHAHTHAVPAVPVVRATMGVKQGDTGPAMDRLAATINPASGLPLALLQAGFMWRYARALYDVAQEEGGAKRGGSEEEEKEEAKAMTYAALRAAREALRLAGVTRSTRDVEQDSSRTAGGDGGDARGTAAAAAACPGHPIGKCHKWAGIALNATGDFEGTSASIANAHVIKAHWEAAVAADPSDATSWHLLGRWAFALADLGWASRAAASFVFGKPPSATFAEALAYFERAEAVSPGFWKKNAAMLGTTLLKLPGREAEARPWLEKARAIKTVTQEDEECAADVERLLKKL